MLVYKLIFGIMKVLLVFVRRYYMTCNPICRIESNLLTRSLQQQKIKSFTTSVAEFNFLLEIYHVIRSEYLDFLLPLITLLHCRQSWIFQFIYCLYYIWTWKQETNAEADLAVNYYHKALHLGCCSSPRSASALTYI